MKFAHWLALASLIAAGLLFWSLREFIILIFASIVIAMAICTVVQKTRSIKQMPRVLALIISIVSLFLLSSLLLVLVVPAFLEEFEQLIIQLPTAGTELWELANGAINKLTDIIYGEDLSGFADGQIILKDFNPIPDSGALASGIGDGVQSILGLASNLSSGFIQFLFVFTVSVMISIQPNAYREVAISLLPSFYRRRARQILLKCGDALSNWMVGVLISSVCVGILAGLGLSVLGVKLVTANALLAGMLNIIPNVGPVLSTIFPVSVALLDSPWKALAVVCLYVIIQNIESYIITPSVMHHQVKLLPALTLTAQFIFTILFGPIGLLLSLPLAVVLQVLIKEIIIHDLLDPWKKDRLMKSAN